MGNVNGKIELPLKGLAKRQKKKTYSVHVHITQWETVPIEHLNDFKEDLEFIILKTQYRNQYNEVGQSHNLTFVHND